MRRSSPLNARCRYHVDCGRNVRRLDVLPYLREQLWCGQCRGEGTWVRDGRRQLRQNSIIERLRCRHCGERIVAKSGRGTVSSEHPCASLRDEFETLCRLEKAFHAETDCGSLEPLGLFAVAGYDIMVTRMFPGDNLVKYVRGLDSDGLELAFRRAGTWLRKLHSFDPPPGPAQSLGTEEKIEYLKCTYARMLAGRRERRAFEVLVDTASDGERTSGRVLRLHGDFKPENILCNRARCIGLDVQSGITGSASYDLAPFLDHVWLARLGTRAGAADRRDCAERGFLAGYGRDVDLHALRWVQLYFALCYLGNYGQRGVLHTGYARWKLWPLVRHLTSELRRDA